MVTALTIAQSSAVAGAVSPPPIDEHRLPAAGPAAPASPTAQFATCVVAPPEPTAAAGQLTGLDLPSVWALTRGAGQTVAVIDTGVARHRRLPHLVAGGDYVSHHDGTADCDGHGTIVAGIIGATPDSADPGGFSGVAPDVSVLSIRQSSNKFHAIDDPGATGVGDVASLAAAVRTAADLGATVINISTVACVPVGAELDDQELGAALSYAVELKNVVVVAAAGNVGGPGQCLEHNPRETPSADEVAVVVSPAWYDGLVLTVGSVGADGAPSDFSLAGPWVDVAAPGENVVSLASAGDGLAGVSPAGAPLSGTSYAAPVVSAVAAMVRARFPELTARQVMQRIEDTAHHSSSAWNPVVGHGVVDPLAAVSGPGATSAAPSVAVPIRTATATAAESAPLRKAIDGAAICFALTVTVAALSAAVARLRRRVEAVSDD
ncbi:type VII secretion-associated serine protease mycosin [Mycobacterium sp. 236(2023)]|uniref:type VII secretion-associated serine protease mycosin n=1 Tax=Mycobacterium sp. 236(2023) TaxID=3038163 RepID=UPI0024153EEB|nr:type VII secretion-associated serine protease mycosin [Mycobacterium sp. 236(2023)]MDG4664013.1 type VII secretion-associated serine protease mycosin [Mycobacterium sp. 236(2023)]